MNSTLRIGTRDSQLALWQATTVQQLLEGSGIPTEIVPMKSEGDIDTVTPLYELGVQGVFTKTLDAALLSKRIDIAVHSMKDMPTRLARGVRQAAVLKRGSHKDILVFKGKQQELEDALNNEQRADLPFTVATSSIRRMAQWLHRYPHHQIENLRGNVNTRLRKVAESNWNGAIFAAAGLERIHLRPESSIDLDWMLPAPSQGAIMVVCREEDERSFEACQSFNDEATALCTGLEKDFLRVLMGGCSTPISALAELKDQTVHFRGSICSTDGAQLIEVTKEVNKEGSSDLGAEMARELLQTEEAQAIINTIRNAKN
jgi:hydroxymethylbilane synthase